jgi:divinyl chlorophyllide a 8-vinyl-reductase
MTPSPGSETVCKRFGRAARRVFVVGATGTIGRATVSELLARGYAVTCFVRPGAGSGGATRVEPLAGLGAVVRFGSPLDPESLWRDGFRGERFDVLVSCMASRTGAPKDAWRIDHQAHLDVLEAARRSGVTQVVLLSAICVQKPMLAFQHAKLAFEAALKLSGLTFTIVRPTAFFKSLSGQIERVRSGKPFLVFGDGTLTACKPISDRDLARFMVDCLEDESRHDRVLPIGGPGDAITPRQQGEHLFSLLGQPARFRCVPVQMLDAVAGVLGAAGWFVPAAADKAELARIGRYYATESMLVWDAKAHRYDADATPSFGADTLWDYYEQLVRGDAAAERGEHSVFNA